MRRHMLLAAGLLAGGSYAATAPAQTAIPPTASPQTATPQPAMTTPAAPVAAPTRVRGTIAALNGNILSVTARDGQKLDIVLADPPTVMAVKNVDLASIGSNTYIGTATRTGADGKMTAIEVLVFPEAMRGAGEGHYGWDLEPGSMMTNGTVRGAVSAAAGRELTVGYKDASQTVHVPPGVPVVTFVPAAREDLKPGAKVFLAATRNAEGKWSTARVTVGKDGVDPPM